MKIIDYHIHSHNSFDSKSTIIKFCNEAIEKGIKEICFTEHFSVDARDVSYNVLDYEKYNQEIRFSKEIVGNKLIIKKGLEIGEPHIKEYELDLNEQLSKMDLDFIIGSIHNIDGIKLRTFINNNEDKDIYVEYFKEVYEMVKVSDIDVIGHLDLMKRYAYKTLGNYDFKKYYDIIEKILKLCIKRNIGIEINTSGLRSELNETLPSKEIIKLYKDLGGEIITIGSDSHDYKDVGYSFNKALEILRLYNYKYVFTFEKRKPIAIKILK